MATIDTIKTKIKNLPRIDFALLRGKIRDKIISFLRHQKPIAGLAIAEDSLSVIIFNKTKGMFGERVEIDSSNRQSIKNGLIAMKKKFGANFSSAVLSLPPNWSYLTKFEFPLSTSEEQIKEAMTLAPSSLPKSESEIYFDWMPIKNENAKKKEVVLEMAQKNLIDSYLEICEKNNIGVLAAETFIWSVGQFLPEGDDIALVILEQPKMITFAVYDGQIPYFQFNLPKDKGGESDKFDIHYLKSIIHFVATDNSQTREVKSIIAITSDKLLKEIQNEVEIKVQKGFTLSDEMQEVKSDEISEVNDLSFLAAAGAMKRGLIPRRKDKNVSLLPLNTETAYEQHRFFLYIDFIQKFSISFAIFLIIGFTGISLMNKVLLTKIGALLIKEQGFSNDTAPIIDQANIFNSQVAQFEKIDQTTPRWERVFAAIDDLTANLTLTQINVSTIGDVSFSGIAPDRASLVKLKDNLAASKIFISEPMPFSIFLNNKNISFNIKAKLKDITMLY